MTTEHSKLRKYGVIAASIAAVGVLSAQTADSRAYAAELMADAQSRASLLQPGSAGFAQFRYTVSMDDEGAGSNADPDRSEFTLEEGFSLRGPFAISLAEFDEFEAGLEWIPSGSAPLVALSHGNAAPYRDTPLVRKASDPTAFP